MAGSPALTVAENTALSGPSTLLRYLSPVPDVTLATALINQSTFTYPLAHLTVDTTSGWSSVRAGDTVFVGTTSGASDIGIYRVRLTPGSTTLYIGETSSQDPGQLPVSIRTASFANNQFITVKRRFDLWSVLPVINPSTGATYEDYDQTVGTSNTTPPPLVNVTINNRRNHLATLVADGATFALSAVATPTSWPTSSGETFTYAWTTPSSGWSSVSGTTTTTLTATVAPGNYVLYLSVTGSLSGTTQRACFVHVHDTSTNPPLLISEMPRSDVRDRTGRRMSFDLYSNRLESIPDGAACLYFEVCTWAAQWSLSGGTLSEDLDTSETGVDVSNGALFTTSSIILIDREQMRVTGISNNTLTVTRAYNGTTAATHANGTAIYLYAPATDVPTATRQMVGWVQRQDKSGEGGLRQATIELISPSYLLNQLNSTSQIVTAASSPSSWQEVKPAISTASFLAWYMLRWRCANVLLLFNYTPFSVAAAGQRLPSWTVDKGTVLQQIQQLATERGNFGCDSEGEFYFLRHPNLVAYGSRSGIVVRDSVSASIYASVSNPRELMNRVQQVRGEAFSWDGSATLPTPYYSDAPKVPAQGTSQIKLPGQVVTDQSELNQLTGDRYQQANNPYPSISYTVKKNRDVIEPAQMPFVSVAIPDYLSASDAAYQGNIIPISVNKTHNPDGTSDLTVTGEGETHNLTGDYVPVPVGNDSLFTPSYVPSSIEPLPLPSLGEFNSIVIPAAVPAPAGGAGETVSPGKGAIWVSADGSSIKRTLDITVEPPDVDDVTPDDTFFTSFVMVVHAKTPNFSRAAYALGNDGTDSKVAYTTDIYADTVEWTVGGALTGLYTQIESAGLSSLAGGVVVYGTIPAGEALAYDFDFTVSNQGFVSLPTGGPNQQATYHAGQGWGRGVDTGRIGIQKNVGGSFIRAVLTYNESMPSGSFVRVVSYPYPPYTVVAQSTVAASVYDLSYASTPGFSMDSGPSGGSLSTTIRLTRVQLYETVFDAVVATSDDYGATFAVETIGDAPSSEGAFCLSRFGPVALAAVDGTLEKATVFGGAFSPVTGGGTTGTYPLACRIPWFKIGQPSQTNNSTSPDFYLASAVAISTESLWKVIGGVQTAVTPSVTGTKAVGVSSNCIGTYGANRICFIGNVSGTIYIFRSTNSGTSWTNTAVSGATSVRAQRFSPSGLIWIAGTSTNLRYSSNGGSTWQNRTASGGALYAELMG
jgi:hypothetical protein